MRFLRKHAPYVALAILLIQGLSYYALASVEPTSSGLPWSQFPSQIDRWSTLEDLPLDSTILENLKPDDYLNRTYRDQDSGLVLSLFVGYFRSQRNGNLPHSPTSCLPGAGWREISQSAFPLTSASGASFPVNLYTIERQQQRIAVLFWYQLGADTYTEMWKAQLFSLPNLMLHRNTHQIFVRVVTPLDPTGSIPPQVASFAGRLPSLMQPHF